MVTNISCRKCTSQLSYFKWAYGNNNQCHVQNISERKCLKESAIERILKHWFSDIWYYLNAPAYEWVVMRLLTQLVRRLRRSLPSQTGQTRTRSWMIRTPSESLTDERTCSSAQLEQCSPISGEFSVIQAIHKIIYIGMLFATQIVFHNIIMLPGKFRGSI